MFEFYRDMEPIIKEVVEQFTERERERERERIDR